MAEAAAAKKPKFYRVRSPFIHNDHGVDVPYLVGNVVYTDDHPIVIANLGAFEEVVPLDGKKNEAVQLPVVEEPAPVEQATAGPGETRTVPRSKR